MCLLEAALPNDSADGEQQTRSRQAALAAVAKTKDLFFNVTEGNKHRAAVNGPHCESLLFFFQETLTFS